jgi:glycosyltransferase involved in cell wall biosynthesis
VFDITIPQKTQAYMLAGRPILMAVGGEAGEIVRNAKAGVAVQPCQPAQLAKAAIALSELPPQQLHAMGARGRTYYKNKMSIDHGVALVAGLLTSVVEGR